MKKYIKYQKRIYEIERETPTLYITKNEDKYNKKTLKKVGDSYRWDKFEIVGEDDYIEYKNQIEVNYKCSEIKEYIERNVRKMRKLNNLERIQEIIKSELD